MHVYECIKELTTAHKIVTELSRALEELHTVASKCVFNASACLSQHVDRFGLVWPNLPACLGEWASG